MKGIEKYLKQHALSTDLVHDMQPNADLELVVVIPACNEKEFLANCLASLTKASPILGSVEILVIVNDGMSPNDYIKTQNQDSLGLIRDYYNANNPKLKILSVYVDISKFKKPGVGLARKIGMDEAIRRYLSLFKDGLIVCLDADCTVQENYFQSIVNGFYSRPKQLAASLHFEHSLSLNKDKIIQYESHLRYFIGMQREIELPFAVQTIGSSMAVRASAYCKYGGMNTRQAGEDFYFLQKFIANNVCFEINDTTVFPSDRGSERVPFGTGKAINKLEESREELLTYHPENFFIIHKFITQVFKVYQDIEFKEAHFKLSNPHLVTFLKTKNYLHALNEIKSNTSNFDSFKKRFYQWFNAFMLMKCLHYLREGRHPDIPITHALDSYFNILKVKCPDTPEIRLNELRRIAKEDQNFL